jgi:hypothetical protein
MRVVSPAGALLLGGLLWAQGAAAATITTTIGFTAHDFTAIYGSLPAPVSPVSGSFTLTFDPTLVYTNQTSGIVLNGIDIAADGVPAFSYVPHFSDVMTIGMILAGGADSLLLGTNDFILGFNLTAPNVPLNAWFGYSQLGLTDSYFFTSHVAITQVNQTPIPGSVLMLLTGLGAIGGAGFLRKRNAAAGTAPAAA